MCHTHEVNPKNFCSEAEYVMAVHRFSQACIVPVQTFQCGSCGKNNLVPAIHPTRSSCCQPSPVYVTPTSTVLPARETAESVSEAKARVLAYEYTRGFRDGLSRPHSVEAPTLASAIIIALALCTGTIVICGMIAAITN